MRKANERDLPLGKRNELYFLTSSYSLAESNFNRTGRYSGIQVFGTVRYSVRNSVLGILVMTNADGVRGVSGRNCSAVCCVVQEGKTCAGKGSCGSEGKGSVVGFFS